MESGYTIGSVMVKEVISVDSSKTIRECAKIMKEKKIGCLIITTRKKIVGIITEQDMTRKVIAEKINPEKVKVKEIMSKKIKTVEPEKDISEAIKIMKGTDIEHVPVVSKGKLVGIITTNNIIKRMYIDKYLLLSKKKAFLIAGIWVASLVIHTAISNYSGVNEVFFAFLAMGAIPAYLVIALIYTIFRYKLIKKIN